MTSPPAHLQQVGEGKFPSPLAPLQQAGEGEECNVVDEFFFRVFCEKICVICGKHFPSLKIFQNCLVIFYHRVKTLDLPDHTFYQSIGTGSAAGEQDL